MVPCLEPSAALLKHWRLATTEIHNVDSPNINWDTEPEESLYYCTISINSAGPVTRDGPAENLVSATTQSCRDIPKFLGNFRQFSAAGHKKNSILVT